MINKYKIENWKKGHKRKYPDDQMGITKKGQEFFYAPIERLVKRDKKGHFISVLETRVKTYGSGTYKVGIKNNKVVTRKKIGDITTIQYQREKREMMKGNIFRCSLALNDIPYEGTDYYGFRIIAFSRKKTRLEKIYPQKMYDKLIQFIEKCLKYHSDEFWFNHYLNYMGKISPEISNASFSENGKYYLLWTKRKTGSIMKQDFGRMTDL